MEQAWWLSIIGGLLALDHAMVGQFMLCQPIVVGGIFGACLGDAPTGLLIGAMVQLLWLNALPVGAFIPSDYTVAGGITVALSIFLMKTCALPLEGAMVLALALAIPGGYIAGKLDVGVRQLNNVLAGHAEDLADRYGTAGITLLNFGALVPAGLRNFLVYLVWLGPVAVLAQMLVPHFPPWFWRGLQLVFWAMPILSAAVILDLIAKRRLFGLVAVVGLLMALGLAFWPMHALWIFSGVVVVGAAVAGWGRSW